VKEQVLLLCLTFFLSLQHDHLVFDIVDHLSMILLCLTLVDNLSMICNFVGFTFSQMFFQENCEHKMTS
jgi:hypothetical protein